MSYVYNNPKKKDVRRILRKNQTEEEKLLWNRLRNKQLNELKFFRQYSVGRYILDFYCPKLRLAIELDGNQHAEKSQKEYDEKRTEFLRGENIITLRFWNNEVVSNIEGVLEKIIQSTKSNSI